MLTWLIFEGRATYLWSITTIAIHGFNSKPCYMLIMWRYNYWMLFSTKPHFLYNIKPTSFLHSHTSREGTKCLMKLPFDFISWAKYTVCWENLDYNMLMNVLIWNNCIVTISKWVSIVNCELCYVLTNKMLDEPHM